MKALLIFDLTVVPVCVFILLRYWKHARKNAKYNNAVRASNIWRSKWIVNRIKN